MVISSLKRSIIIILVLTLFAVWVDLPKGLKVGKFEITHPNINFKLGQLELKRSLDLVLGLDLAGGSHLVFDADTAKISSEKKAEAIAAVRNVIERRVNLFGVSEPNVVSSSFEGKNRIIVELPGVKNPKEAIGLIGKTAQLVFAEVEESSQSASTKEEKIILHTTDLTGADITEARTSFDKETGKPVVLINFSKPGGEKFGKITEKNIGKKVAMVLDKQIISAPVVQEKITETAQIRGNFSLDSAKELAIQLNAGALPIPVNLVEERTVGATLGIESVNKSIKAGLVGLFMVLLFMVLAYGKLGLLADLGLMVFGVLTLSLYKLIPIVLTLPGISGFLLSVGMAVDSNILIFERFKEEKVKHPISNALEISFGRAWDSIRDANIATLVTAFILANPFDWPFLHTSGPVRGFAITLTLGVAISLFTGIVVSRNLLRFFVREK